ncbi:MAG: 6-phosphogluconolactonase [Ignavibacteriales bacterium]|nr:6-phosphogluconolactonase [Ignavibacteriales bacterium]
MKYIFETKEETVKQFAENLILLIKKSAVENRKFNIALSGGNTPKILFKFLKQNYLQNVDWKNVHFYWGDERCVPAESDESNYGHAFNLFLNSEKIPKENIHRIMGEANAKEEAERYSKLIQNNLKSENNFPQFDFIMLGLGEDGHTASIFPNQMELLTSAKICDVAEHPISGQKRITLTGPLINNAKNISFLVTGKSKAKVIENIFEKKNNYNDYPASHIKAINGNLTWFLDKEVSNKL